MKNCAFLVASAVVCASAAVFADNVQGDNVFGVMPVTSGTVDTLVAVPWCECSATDDQPITISNIVKTANLSVDDKVYVVGSDGKYNAWELKETGGVLYWCDVVSVSEWGVLTNRNASLAAAARGSAIILHRHSPTNTDGSAKTFYLFGQVGASSTVSTTIDAGETALIAPPRYVEGGVDILKSNNAEFTANNGDKILVRRETKGAPREYTFNGTDWTFCPPPTYANTSTNSIVIPCGLGAWYKATSRVTITWKGVPAKTVE